MNAGIDAALAERAREWLFPLTHENFLAEWQKRKVTELAGLLAVCANEALERAKSILLASYTYHAHIQICWCERCAYVRANVTEINVLQGALKAEG